MLDDALDSYAENDLAITRQSPYGTIAEPTYAGVTSFLRRRYSRDVAHADLAVIGLPFDLATSNRPGARFGPRAIRAASAQLAWAPPYGWDFDPCEQLHIVDYGDALFDPGEPGSCVRDIHAIIARILAEDCATLGLGGDHFITYPVIKAYAEKYGSLSLIHFDAHSDTWREPTQRIDHGTMFFHAAQQNIVSAPHSTQIGLRTKNEETHGFNIFDAAYLHEHGVKRVVEQVRGVVGNRPVYLSFDIDFLDPSIAPGTGTPVVGGFNAWQARQLLHGLRGINIVGMDVMEVSPPFDHSEVTALTAATLALDMAALLACNPIRNKKARFTEKSA